MQLGFPHHTAIDDTVQGTLVTLLHQHINNVRRVQMSQINMADLVSGSMTAYRAVPKN